MTAGTTARPVPTRRPLKTPLRDRKSPLVVPISGATDPTDPRYPCSRCHTRPSEVITGPTLADGWLCRFCYNRPASSRRPRGGEK
jgi:hypothetical protein